jgi:hypothetical protein
MSEKAGASAAVPGSVKGLGTRCLGQDKLRTVAVLNVGRMDGSDKRESEDIDKPMALAPIDLPTRIATVLPVPRQDSACEH